MTIHAFAGNTAGTVLPVIESLMTARQLPDVTVVADAGISDANQKAIEVAGCHSSSACGVRTSLL